jgi:hypothetical protein
MVTEQAWKALAAVKDAVWKNPFAWPGGYTIAIYINGDRCCNKCMRENWASVTDLILHSWRAPEVCIGVHWEGSPDYCADCGEVLEAEYGDPWAEDED